MKRVRSTKVNGETCKVFWRGKADGFTAFGECSSAERIIVFSTDLDPVALCDVILHEVLHQAIPQLSEEAVNQYAIDASDLLHRIGLINDDAIDD